MPAPVLAQSDFTYLGYYDLPTAFPSTGGNFTDTGYTSLTLRYKSGDLYFLMEYYNGNAADVSFGLAEFQLPADPHGTHQPDATTYGQTIPDAVNWWNDIYVTSPATNMNRLGTYGLRGISWDAVNNRLWTAVGFQYQGVPIVDPLTDANCTVALEVRTLTDGTPGPNPTAHGPWGVSGLTCRAIAGCVIPLPASFQSAYGLTGYPYMAGFGGGASTIDQSISAAPLGPFFVALKDPSPAGLNLANGGNLSAGQYKVLSDCSGFTPPGYDATSSANCWWDSASPQFNGLPYPTAGDRGVRNKDIVNAFDPYAGHPDAWNPATCPAPLGPWMWTEHYHATATWIDGPNRQGVVCLLSSSGGNALYDSAVNYEKTIYEFHVYDPADFGHYLNGDIHPQTGVAWQSWQIKPKNRWAYSPTKNGTDYYFNVPSQFPYGMGQGNGTVNFGGTRPESSTYCNFYGGCWDASAKKLYLIGTPTFVNGTPRIFVFSVNA